MYRITDDRQQQCLEKFFAKEKTWYPDYFGCKFAAYMMFFCGIIGWLFPYQAEWVSIHESIKTYGIYTMIYLLGFSFYSQMFTSYKGSKRNRKLGEILQNLPVSSVQTAIFKAKNGADYDAAVQRIKDELPLRNEAAFGWHKLL